jgi:hypothetical protein
MPFLPGEILNQRYRILYPLSEGRAGAVYSAWDVKDKRDTAVKEYLDPELELQQEFRAQACARQHRATQIQGHLHRLVGKDFDV